MEDDIFLLLDDNPQKPDASVPTGSIEINGVKWIRAPVSVGRCVLVVDRGWIFAGDLHESGGRIVLTNAVWVFRWEKIGFDAVIGDPKQSGVFIRKMSVPVDVPRDSEIFRVPVHSQWGL